MIYGYIRVSTEQQNIKNQRHEILNFSLLHNITIDKWVSEIISSRRSLKDRKLDNLLRCIKKNDIIIISELSRLGRNLLEVMNILQVCLNKECIIISVKENYRLGYDIQSKVLAFAFSLAAEIERQLISDRTKSALQRLKNEGKKLGRPKGSAYKKLDEQRNKIKELLSKNLSKAEIARSMQCSWLTLHRYIKECL